MKTVNQNTRRTFLSTSLKGAFIVSAGAALTNNLFSPIAALAQNADVQLQAKIATLGTISLQTSQLALTKAINADVKLFAKFEAAEQETMGKILKDLGTIVPAPSEEGKAMLSKLQSLSGSAFDIEFMKGQYDTHKKLKEAVSSLMSTTTSKDVKHVTSLALATIQEHTERSQMLLGKLS